MAGDNTLSRRQRLFVRVYTCIGLSTLVGSVLGAFAGSIVPVIGTFFGGVYGLANGLLCAAVVTPLVVKRNLAWSFTVMGVSSAAVAATGVILFFTTRVLDNDSRVVLHLYAAVTATYLASAVVCRLVLPDELSYAECVPTI